MDNFNWFAESTDETFDQNLYIEEFNKILYEFADKMIETDHIIVNEDGSLGLYGAVSSVDESKEEKDEKAKRKKAIKQVKAAVKSVFKANNFKFHDVFPVLTSIGHIPFTEGTSNSFAITFSKWGRTALTLVLSGGIGAAGGAVASTIPALTIPAEVGAISGAVALAMKSTTKDEKELQKFFEAHRNDIKKALAEQVEDYDVEVKQMKGTSNLIFTVKKKKKK